MPAAVVKGRASGDGFYIIPAEGAPFFISEKLLSEHTGLSVYDGEAIDGHKLTALQLLYNCFMCRKKAMQLLAAREHSVFELRLKLGQKQFGTTEIEKTLAYLQEKDYVSDLRFAKVFIRSRLRRKPEGKAIILERLKQKGVCRAVCDVAWQEEVDENTEAGLLDKAVRLAIKKYAGNCQKQLAYLVRSGFPYPKAKRKLSELSERKDV
jgi:regulatory protein